MSITQTRTFGDDFSVTIRFGIAEVDVSAEKVSGNPQAKSAQHNFLGGYRFFRADFMATRRPSSHPKWF